MDRHSLAAFDVRDRARCHVANRLLEDVGPALGLAVPYDVERQKDLGSSLVSALSRHELPQRRALSPVDVTRIFSVAKQLQSQVVVAMASAEVCSCSVSAARGERGELKWVHGGVNDELPVRGYFSGLFEEAEGEACRDPKSDVAIPAAPGRRPAVRSHLRAARTDLEEEATFVGRLIRPKIFHFDRIRGDAGLVIEDLDLYEVRPAYLRAKRESTDYGQPSKAQLAHEPAHDDQREEHSEQ